MSDTAAHDPPASSGALIEDLVADLTPVRRVVPPMAGAAIWVSIVLLVAIVLAIFADLPAVARRLTAAPDMWLAVVGSTLTAIAAAAAAFQLAMPDRAPRWALLPLPPLALWVGASGLGCERTWLVAGTSDASLGETMDCLRFIVLLSIPFSLVIFRMLRRGYTLHPTLTAAAAGLAVAAASATLLTFFHPFDATFTDLGVHAAAVTLVVVAARTFGGSMLRPARRGPR